MQTMSSSASFVAAIFAERSHCYHFSNSVHSTLLPQSVGKGGARNTETILIIIIQSNASGFLFCIIALCLHRVTLIFSLRVGTRKCHAACWCVL